MTTQTARQNHIPADTATARKSPLSLRNLNTGLAVLGALFIIYVGINYSLTPGATAPSFGLPHWPHGDGGGFLRLKGIRDIVSGLVVLPLLLTRQRRAIGWVMLVQALTPIGDMVTVLSHHGSPATAFGVHGVTAAMVLATGLLFLRETRNTTPPVRS